MDANTPKLDGLPTSHKAGVEYSDVGVIGKANEPFRNLDLSHSTFRNTGALRTVYERCDFSFVTFDRAYFRKCTFHQCKFIGARFRDSNFRGVTMTGCDLSYATFQQTLIPADAVIGCMPGYTHVQAELAKSLRLNCLQTGDQLGAQKAFAIEMRSTGAHLSKAWRQHDGYYTDKYPTWKQRGPILVQSILHWCSEFLWGHGHAPQRLPRFAVMMVLLGAGMLCADSQAMFGVAFADAPGTALLTSAYYSAMTFMGGSVGALSPPTAYLQWVTVGIAGTGYVILGLFVASMFQRLSWK